MLLDSNIIIYASKPEFSFLDNFLTSNIFWYSSISYVEVLGYSKLKVEERVQIEELLNIFTRIPVSENIIFKATQIRQQKSLSLGDSLIAATAIIHRLPLITRNEVDFANIEEIKIVNPFL